MEFTLWKARRGNDDKAVVTAITDIAVTGSHQSALLHGLSDGTECFLIIQHSSSLAHRRHIAAVVDFQHFLPDLAADSLLFPFTQIVFGNIEQVVI